LFAISAPVHSIGILDAYSLALEKDPTFRAAIKEKEAGMKTKTSAGRGCCRRCPANYQNSPRNWQTQKYPASDIFGNSLGEATKRQQYRSHSSSITLTQPLFDYEAYARYKAAWRKR
jgi:protease secretion system outer membrane protein